MHFIFMILLFNSVKKFAFLALFWSESSGSKYYGGYTDSIGDWALHWDIYLLIYLLLKKI